MKDLNTPPYSLHEGAIALNAVIKAISNVSILSMELSNGISISMVAQKANEVADFLKIERSANNDMGRTVIAVQKLIDKIIVDSIISKSSFELIYNEEYSAFKKMHNI